MPREEGAVFGLLKAAAEDRNGPKLESVATMIPPVQPVRSPLSKVSTIGVRSDVTVATLLLDKSPSAKRNVSTPVTVSVPSGLLVRVSMIVYVPELFVIV
jgi:hypothetical protein